MCDSNPHTFLLFSNSYAAIYRCLHNIGGRNLEPPNLISILPIKLVALNGSKTYNSSSGFTTLKQRVHGKSKLSLHFCIYSNYFNTAVNSDWHISTSRDPSKKKYDHKSLLVGLYHDKKIWFRPKIKKLILARSQNHGFSNHAFSTLLRFQNTMLVRNLAITMHFLGVNGFLWMKSTS